MAPPENEWQIYCWRWGEWAIENDIAVEKGWGRLKRECERVYTGVRSRCILKQAQYTSCRDEQKPGGSERIKFAKALISLFPFDLRSRREKLPGGNPRRAGCYATGARTNTNLQQFAAREIGI